jgi:nitrate/nitrite transporter NarK
VFVGFAVWTVFSILVSLSAGLEVLLTLELIGLLITVELTSGLLSKELRARMEYFIYTGLLLFVVVVLRRVWLILS